MNSAKTTACYIVEKIGIAPTPKIFQSEIQFGFTRTELFNTSPLFDLFEIYYVHATSTNLVTFAGASLNCAFTLATVFSTDRPYFFRSSSCVEACSMN
jgi:hypothetical protein